jgi:hypothetical protein
MLATRALRLGQALTLSAGLLYRILKDITFMGDAASCAGAMQELNAKANIMVITFLMPNSS